MTAIDLDFVRSQFPAFAEPSLQGTAFFENAGGSYMCAPVLERLTAYCRRLKLQPYYPNPPSSEAGAWMDDSHRALAQWMNVAAEDVYFGPSTTANVYVLAQAALGWLQPGDEIIVTDQDHEANSGAWRRLADRGIEVREWGVNRDTGSLEIDALEPLFTNKTKLLAFPHCSNIIGEINPAAQICALAKARGVRTVVDGVSYAGHGLPDVQAMGADVYLYSLYKVYGPHQGVMVMGAAMADLLSNQGHFFNAGSRRKRLTPAGPDHAQIAASQGVAEYFEALHAHHFGPAAAPDLAKADALRGLLRQAEHAVLAPLLAYVNDAPRLRVIGPSDMENRAPTVSLDVTGLAPGELAQKLGEAGFLVGCGHCYAYRLLEALGLDVQRGVLRLSMVHYTGVEEVERLIEALDRAVA